MAKDVQTTPINTRGHASLKDEFFDTLDWVEETLYNAVEERNFVSDYARSHAESSYEYY